MLNPGSSRPLNNDVNKPFENYTFNQYVELEIDETMNVFMDIFTVLQKEKKYLSGIVEIKNLFNYRKSKLLSDDWIFMTDCIKKGDNSLNTKDHLKLNGDFVFFAWGTTKLINKEIKNYSRKILHECKEDDKTILFVSPKSATESEKYLSFYHPLGGHWKIDKRQRFNDSLYQVFRSFNPIVDFK